MQQQLQPHARYLKWVEGVDENHYGHWTTLAFEDVKKEFPGKATEMGVLEVMAFTAD